MQKVSLFHLFNLVTQLMLEPGDQIEKIPTQKIFDQIATYKKSGNFIIHLTTMEFNWQKEF